MSGDGPRASTTTIQSVSRAAKLLIAVATHPDGLAAKPASELLSLTLPTTYHLLTTLAAEGLIVKDSRRHYVLGPRASVIASAVSRDTQAPEHYMRGLRDLAADTGETAYVSAWRNGSICVLGSVDGAHAVRVAGLTVGYGDNVHARASGKLLMAFAPPADRDRLLSATTLQRLTPTTITDRAELDREFARIRADNLAFDRAEFRHGVHCVSAPILEDGFVVACYTVSTPEERWHSESDKISDAVQRAATSASDLRIKV